MGSFLIAHLVGDFFTFLVSWLLTEVPKAPLKTASGREAASYVGSPKVYCLHGKLHRNEKSQCFRAFSEATGRHDRKYPFKSQPVEDAWAKALAYFEDHAKERAKNHALPKLVQEQPLYLYRGHY